MKFKFAILSFLLVSCAHTAQDAGNDIWQQNLDLAREGQLAEKAFCLEQTGTSGLFPDWDKTENLAIVLANIYYEAGHIALAQRMAFEADVCKLDGHNPDMIRLLVKTNLIYGEWTIAEKYMVFLEKDGHYRRWAMSQRYFLHNMAAVETDPEYGQKRRCLPQDFPSSYRGIDKDLEDIANANPYHLNTLEFLGLYYLLVGDMPAMDDFASLMRKYYGPDSGKVLPRSFAEACCILSSQYKNFWQKMGVSKELHKSYDQFLSKKDAGGNLDEYKDTYWHYYFVKLGNI